MRLVDLDQLLNFPIRMNNYDKEHGNEHFIYGIETALEYAENLPIINLVESEGEWIECDYKTLEHGEIETHYNAGLVCSKCRVGFKKENLPYKKFCPSCGARMKEVSHD